jgi:hypothetical protein
MALRPEQITHINIVNWFRHDFPELADDFHHFANERKCTQQEGRTLKRMGVIKGVWDFFLGVPLDEYHGLWIELKVGKNKMTKEQIEFGVRKSLRGYAAVPCVGFDAVKHTILAYLKNYIPNREKLEQKFSTEYDHIVCACFDHF